MSSFFNTLCFLALLHRRDPKKSVRAEGSDSQWRLPASVHQFWWDVRWTSIVDGFNLFFGRKSEDEGKRISEISSIFWVND